MKVLGSYVGHDPLVEYAVSQLPKNRGDAPLEAVLFVDPTGIGWGDLMFALSMQGDCTQNLSSTDLTRESDKGLKSDELVRVLARARHHLYVWYDAQTMTKRKQQLLIGSLRDGLTYAVDSDSDVLWDDRTQAVEPIRIWLFARTREGLLDELVTQLRVIEFPSTWPLECLEARAQITMMRQHKSFMGDAVRAHMCATGFSPGAADHCGKVFEHHRHAIVTVDDVLKRSQGYYYGPFGRDEAMIKTFLAVAEDGERRSFDQLTTGFNEERLAARVLCLERLVWTGYIDEQVHEGVTTHRITPLGRKAKGFMRDR